MKKKILIIGKIPPPKGGVGIHVERLVAKLKTESEIKLLFFDMRKEKWYFLPFYIKKSRLVHIHVSNSYLRLIIIIYCRLIGIKVLFTFHGNFGRYNYLRNFFDIMSLKLSNHSILINKRSYNKALKHSKNISMITAFMPPLESEFFLPKGNYICEKISHLRASYKTLFCTNANAITFDKDKTEIYGIFKLIDIFKLFPNLALIISDASGEYTEYFKRQDICIPSNILLINTEHSFIPIINKSDCFIRATSTDGDSLSIREALFLQKSVIASDCVDRPSGCILYKTGDSKDLKNTIMNIKHRNDLIKVEINGYSKVYSIYKQFIYG